MGGAWEIGLLPMTEKELGEGLGLLLAISFWLFPAWPYFTILECSKAQGTLGKRLFGLQVTDLRGHRIGFGRANARYVVEAVRVPALSCGFHPHCVHTSQAGAARPHRRRLWSCGREGMCGLEISEADVEDWRIES